MTSWGLPAGLSPGYVVVTLVVIGAITVALRWLPFLAVARFSDSRAIAYLGTALPVGVMIALVIYTVRDVPQTPALILPSVAGVAVTVAIQYFTGRTGWAVLAGTLAYIALSYLT